MTSWDVTDRLESEAVIAASIDAVFEDGDPEPIKSAIGDAARVRCMTEIASMAGITRAGLYKALADTGNPSFHHDRERDEGAGGTAFGDGDVPTPRQFHIRHGVTEISHRNLHFRFASSVGAVDTSVTIR